MKKFIKLVSKVIDPREYVDAIVIDYEEELKGEE
jgi:hypothetical protein